MSYIGGGYIGGGGGSVGLQLDGSNDLTLPNDLTLTSGQIILSSGDVTNPAITNVGNNTGVFWIGTATFCVGRNGAEIQRWNGADTELSVDLLPIADVTHDIGSSAQQWDDCYIGGQLLAVAGAVGAPSVTVGAADKGFYASDANTVNLSIGGDVKWSWNSGTGANCRLNLRPWQTDTYDLGTSSHGWQDLYLTSNLYIGTTVLNAHGGLAIAADGSEPTMDVNNSYELFNLWDSVLTENGMTGDAGADSEVTVTAAGAYKIDFSISFNGEISGEVWEFALYHGADGAEAINANAVAHREVSANDTGNAGFTTVVDLTAGDNVQLWVKQSVAAERQLDVHHASLVITAVGA